MPLSLLLCVACVVMCIDVGVHDMCLDMYGDMYSCDIWVSASSAILSEVAPILLRPNIEEKDPQTECGAVEISKFSKSLRSDIVGFSAGSLDLLALPPFGLWVLIFITSPKDLPTSAFLPSLSKISRSDRA